MLGLQPNPVGAFGIFATAVMAGAGVVGIARGAQVRRKRLGLESDEVILPAPQPVPTEPKKPQPVPPSDDNLITYVEPNAEELAACGGPAEAWVDTNGNRYSRCVGNTEPASGDATKCPEGYFYDALHKVCCPDGWYFNAKDGLCRPLASKG